MLFFSTPHKSPRKHVSTHTPTQPVGRANLKWENEHEDHPLDILRDLLEDGTPPPYGKHIILRIAQMLNNQLNDDTHYTDYQVGDKIRRLRNAHGHYMAMKTGNTGTRFGWDDDLRTINATSEQWEHNKTVYPKPLFIEFISSYVVCHL
jgi:hypothetical protein